MDDTQTPSKYKRILLKMSGEVLSGDSTSPISPSVLNRLMTEVTAIHQMGVQIAIVIGGGNYCGGVPLSEAGLSRVTGDHMGMLATMMNALALRDCFEQQGVSTAVMSALPISGVLEAFNARQAIKSLEQGCVVIFAGGTGNPYVTTDSAASLRGSEIQADIILKATNVDGVYEVDPKKNPEAKRFERLTFEECLQKKLAIMDFIAFRQCQENHLPIIVFNLTKPGALFNVMTGKNEGTLIEVK